MSRVCCFKTVKTMESNFHLVQKIFSKKKKKKKKKKKNLDIFVKRQ